MAQDTQITHGVVAPTAYDLACGPTQIGYTTTSIAGVPQFSYVGPKGDRTFSSDEISVLASPLGDLVTVTLEDVPDLQSVTLTVLIPRIGLEPGGQRHFATLAIFTTTTTTIAGPPLGVAQTHELILLDGLAKHVVF